MLIPFKTPWSQQGFNLLALSHHAHLLSLKSTLFVKEVKGRFHPKMKNHHAGFHCSGSDGITHFPPFRLPLSDAN